MADAQANIGIGVDISDALAQIRQLQREISAFHTSMAKGGALANAESARLSQNLVNTINAGGKFSAGMTQISSSTESFTNALEKNKLSMNQYFKYAGGASRSFGKMFSREFNTVTRVATERVKDLQTQYISMGRDANGALQSIKVRPLSLDMNDLGTKVQMVAQKQQIFNQLLKQGSTNLLNFGKNTQWAGRQLMVGFTIPLTIFGATAAREFQKLEEQAVKFRRVYGDMFTTDAETEKALANIRELADEFTKYGIAVEKTVGLAAKVAQMGNVGEDLTQQVTQATRLAVLGGLEQEEALDTTISLTNAFGVAAEDLAGKIAFLNAAENQTILAIEDFNEAIPKAGSVVQQLGGDVEDLAFMLTAMREGGINASQAANAIKSSLGRMINPTVAAQEKLKGFGIDIMGIVENNAGNLQATIMQLGYALDNLDPLERARAIETLFGKFQFARMSTMFQNIVKDGSQANKVLGLTANTTQELAIIAERELKRVEDSVGFKFQKQLEKLQAALAPIGEEFLKAITPVVEFGTKLLKSFNNLGEGGKQFIVVLTAIAGVVAPAALMAFGLVANGVANLIKFFALLGRGFGMLSGQSKVLGTGTEYMTQQQIEAAAVAASLGQSHSNLIQVFTAEASAVNNLANAYRQAIIAQGAFRGTGAAAAGTIPKPRGYASGGLIVGPGTGTSDSIPAMVSNGEFIINAKRTKQYFPLLQAIAEGKVPGFASVDTGGQQINIGPGQQQTVTTSDVRSITLKIMGVKDEGSMSETQRNKARLIDEELVNEANKSVRDLGLTAQQAVDRIDQGLSGLGQSQTQSAVANKGQLVGNQAFKALKRERTDAQGDVFAHIGGSAATVTAREAVGGISPEDTSAAATYIRDTANVLPDRNVAFKHSWGMKTSRSGNLSLANEGWEKQSMLEDYRSRGASKWDDAFAAGGADAADPDTQFLKQEQDRRLQAKLENSSATRFVDTREDLARLEAAGEDPSTFAVIADLEEEVFQEMQQDQNLLESQRKKHAQIRSTAQENIKSIRSHKYTNEDAQTILDAAKDPSDPAKQASAQRLQQTLQISENESGVAVYGSTKRNVEHSISQKSKQQSEGFGAKPELDKDSQAIKTRMSQIGRAGADGLAEGTEDGLQIASPSRRMFDLGKNAADGLANGFEAGMADEVDPLAAPKPPQVEYMKDDSSIRGRLRGLGNRAKDKFNDSAIGQGIGRKFSDMTGTPLADSQGNLVYDPAASGGVMPVRVVDGFEMDPRFQEAMETGNINSENLSDTLEKQQKTTENNTRSQKEVAKQDRAQKRQALAGKAFGVLGTATMVAGMASQMDGQVGQIAQKAMPALAGLAGIAPILMALPGPLAALVAVLGAAALSIFMLNKKFKDAQKETMEFTRAVGASKQSLKSLAEYAGTVGSGEYMDKEREKRLKLLDSAPGKTTFGEGFVESEAGQAQVESLRAMVGTQGTDAAVASLTAQLSTAVISGILTPAQAQSMAANLAYEIGNMDVGIQVRANIIELVGPNGEDISGGQIVEMGGKLIDQNLESLNSQMAMAQANMDSMAFGTQTERNIGLGGMVAAGAGAGAATGAAVGAAIGAIGGPAAAATAAIGAVVGTLVGGVGAAVGGYFMMQEAAEEAGRQTGAIVGQAMNLLDTQQEISDSLDAYYLKKIDEAKVQGDIAESLRLQAEYEGKKRDLSEQEMQMRESLRASLESGGDAAESARSGISAAIETRFKDDSAAQLILPAIESSLNRLTKSGQMTATDKDLIQLELATTMDPATLNSLLMFVGEDGARVDALVNVIGKFGGQFAGEAQNILGLIEDEDLRSSIFTDISMAGDEQQAQEILDFTREIGKQKGVLNTDVVIDYYNKNPEAKEELDQLFEDVDVQGVKTVEQAYEINPELANPEAFDAAYFDMLPEGDKEQYVKTISMILNMPEPELSEELEKWLSESGPAGGAAYTNSSKPTQIRAYAQAMGYKVTQQLSTQDTTAQEDETPEPTGGGGQKEGFDDLLVGLRNTRQATIDMKRGWDGMQESLQTFLDSGSVGFRGLANQMRGLGVGEGLIERITGMDPDEYEKRKDELFVFDAAGNIVGTTQKLQNLSLAMNSLALGEYMNSQQQFIENTQNQFTAMQKLTAEGLSFVEAYEMVQDQALATAIAMGISKEETAELIRITKMMQEMKEKYNKVSEEEQAAKAVKQTNKEFNNRVAVLNKLASQQGKYTDEQISAILNDSNLSTLFLNPKIDSKTLSQALENARRAADLELQIKVTTEEGKKGLFDELVGEVQDEFNRQEAKIDIDFRLATKNDQNIVNEAQNQIAAIQYQVDDYEAQLKGIEDQEEVINDKYAERYEALEEVAAANERIQRIRSAELDIADALSRGDIAAAARAQQELRATEAQNRAESQKEMLQRQQEAELARVRSESGMSRTDLEDRIKALQDEIFGIEEDSLEPAQERLRIAEYEKQLQVDALEVSGRTRDVWDQIANSTDIATQNTEEFAKNVERALALYEYFVNGVPLDMSLFGDAFDAQLQDLGIDTDAQKATTAMLDIAKGVQDRINEDPDTTDRLTPLEEKALEIAQLNADYLLQKDRLSLQNPNTAAEESARMAREAGFDIGTTSQEWVYDPSRGVPVLTTKQTGGVGGDAMISRIEEAVRAQRERELQELSTTMRESYQKASLDFAKEYLGTNSEGKLTGVSADRLTDAYQKTVEEAARKVTVQQVSSNVTRASSTTSSGQKKTVVSNASNDNRVTTVAPTSTKSGSITVRSGGTTSTYVIPSTSWQSRVMRTFSSGGHVMKYSAGGNVKGYAAGGFPTLGSDNIPAMLTPGEFVVRKRAVQDFGVKGLEAINSGEYSGGSVYNYNLAVNVKSDADPDRIARTVMKQIQRVDSQKVRGNRL